MDSITLVFFINLVSKRTDELFDGVKSKINININILCSLSEMLLDVADRFWVFSKTLY